MVFQQSVWVPGAAAPVAEGVVVCLNIDAVPGGPLIPSLSLARRLPNVAASFLRPPPRSIPPRPPLVALWSELRVWIFVSGCLFPDDRRRRGRS